MKTVHKLILKSYAGPMVLTFFIVLFVFIMQFMWRYIDELVGKGLGMDVILELMMYAAVTLIPMVLPLATLFAAVMTMGNMGENYELLALKSAGVSLPRIMRPLIVLVFFVAVGSFFVANNLVPMAMRKMSALIYDIRQQKQVIEFKDGLFFNLDNDMSIRVDHQDPKTKLLTDILIYDTRNTNINGKMGTIVADSGYISLSDDKRFLLATLYNGEMHEEVRNYQWMKDNTLERRYFDVYNMVIPMSGFDFSRTDMSLFNNSQTKNTKELSAGIDSLEKVSAAAASERSTPLSEENIDGHPLLPAADHHLHFPFRPGTRRRFDRSVARAARLSECSHRQHGPERPATDLQRGAQQSAQLPQFLLLRRGDLERRPHAALQI